MAIILLAPRSTFAQEYNHSCLPPQDQHLQLTRQAQPGQILLEADQVVNDNNERITASGNAIAYTDKEQLKANKMDIDTIEETWNFSEKVTVSSESLSLSADNGSINQKNKSRDFYNVEYEYHPLRATGQTDVVRQQGEVITFEDTTFSTCPPEDRLWELSASSLDIDRDSGFGTARNTWVKVRNFPVFYFPWFRFPIDGERHSGFLMPSLGSSNERGIEANIPLYWNIAPALDATSNFHFMTERGLMIESEFRYLSKESRGILNAHYLSNDVKTGEERFLLKGDHRSQLNRYLVLNANGSYTSDIEYFDTFDNLLEIQNVDRLQRRIKLDYTHRLGDLGLEFLRDQEIDSASEAYEKRPSFTAHFSPYASDNRWQLDVISEITRFKTDEAGDPSGMRRHIETVLGYNYRKPGYFLYPQISWHHTDYDLDISNVTSSLDVPITEIKGGLLFERDTKNQGQQTLEPSLFFAYIPHEDQENLPVFDSNFNSFNFSQLFNPNRFTGVDRVGDTKHIGASLATRLYDSDSNEILRAKIGQLFYLDDRRITLANDELNDNRKSDIIAEIKWTPSDYLSMSSSVLTAGDITDFTKSALDINYQRERKLFNISHRENKVVTEENRQSALSWRWPVSQNFNSLGSWRYDHRQGDHLEYMLGMEYESCCANIRLAARRSAKEDFSDYNNDYFIEFEFNGLASIGNTKDLFKNSIYGYEDSEL